MLQGLPPRDRSVGALKWRFNGAAEEIRGRAGPNRCWRSCRGGPKRLGRLGKGDSLIVNSEGKDRKKEKEKKTTDKVQEIGFFFFTSKHDSEFGEVGRD